MGNRIDVRVEPATVRFVTIERVVLECGDDVFSLDAVDGLSGEDGAEIRIFRVVLVISAVAHVAREVHSTGQHDVEASDACLAAENTTTLARELRIEARADENGRR